MQVTNMSGKEVLFTGSEAECLMYIRLNAAGRGVKLINGKYHKRMPIPAPGTSTLRQIGQWGINPQYKLAGPSKKLP